MTTTQSANLQANASTQVWNFPKLQGSENYQMWVKKMRSALMSCGLWEIVDQGTNIFPKDLPTDPVPTNAQTAAYEPAVKRWKDLNNQASKRIYSMCDEKPANSIKDEDLAMNIWIKLQRDYPGS